MISLAPTNAVALQLLQSRSTDAAPQQTNSGSDVLKIVNGVSVESSAGTKSAAAVIGKFSVDSAISEKPVSGKLVIGDLGSFDTWEEAKAYVEGNNDFSAGQKKDWLEKLDGYAKDLEDAQKFLASDLYKSFASGAHRAELDAMKAASDDRSAPSADFFISLNNVLASQGMTTLVDRMGQDAFDALLQKWG